MINDCIQWPSMSVFFSQNHKRIILSFQQNSLWYPCTFLRCLIQFSEFRKSFQNDAQIFWLDAKTFSKTKAPFCSEFTACLGCHREMCLQQWQSQCCSDRCPLIGLIEYFNLHDLWNIHFRKYIFFFSSYDKNQITWDNLSMSWKRKYLIQIMFFWFLKSMLR